MGSAMRRAAPGAPPCAFDMHKEAAMMDRHDRVSRRGFVRRALGIATGAAAATALLRGGTATAQAKAPKQAVNYQGQPKTVNGTTQKCANCRFYIPPEKTDTELGKCETVKGQVAAQGWCNIWTPAS
jgi:hypothetical protein